MYNIHSEYYELCLTLHKKSFHANFCVYFMLVLYYQSARMYSNTKKFLCSLAILNYITFFVNSLLWILNI